MDTEQTNSAPETETPEVTPTDSGTELSATNETPTETPDTTETPETPAAPAYQPDYKLKVYDEEKELDDPFLKALIKDADSEKKVKEIAQKYLGFEVVKGKHEKLKTDHQSYQQQTQPIVQYYNQASKMLQQGDLEGFFNLVKIPDQVLFQYAVQRAEEANLDPQQKYALQQQRQITRDRFSLAEQNQQLQTESHAKASEYRTQELNWMLSRPDVKQVADSYDQRVNQPGAFRQMVIQKGLAHHAMTQGKEDLNAETAVMEVLKYLQPLVGQNNVAPQTPLVTQPNGQPPIIPKVQGRGTSPVKKQVRSIDDLKKLRNEMASSRQSS